MCNPVAVVMVASTVFSHIQQQQQAKAEEAAARQAHDVNMQTYAEQQRQINRNASAEMSERAREALIERGRLRVLSGESGLAGISNARLENESFFNEGFDMARIEGNRKNAMKQAHLEAQGARANAVSRINSIKRPSVIGSGLQIAGAVTQGMADNKKAKAGSSKKT